jgi:hypothetical protein
MKTHNLAKYNRLNMEGMRYGRVVAIRECGKSSSGDLKWLFKCDCENEFIANGYHVRTGKVISCQKCSAERVRKASIKHGESNSPEFSIWTGIKSRCYNKSTKAYKNYGGRGITICNRWLESFDNFLSDMGRKPSAKHSIERINNDGNYEPNNCRWVTIEKQANNKRNNRKLTINGITKNMAEWAREHNLSSSAIIFRLRKGLSGEDLIAKSQIYGSLSFNGVTDTLKGWSARTGLKQSTISMRINKYKWPVKEALTKGASL